MGPTAADMVALGERMVQPGQFEMPAMRRPPAIAFSPSAKQLYVNGMVFDADDAQSALESEQYLAAEPTDMPTGDWVPLDEQAYGAFLNSIRDPSMSRLAKKNFGRGIDVNQMLGGRLLQFAGAEETGQKVVANQLEDLRKTSPFERAFTDIGTADNRGILDWFVANLAQQGPNIVESAVTAALGGIAGGVAGGGANPFTAAGGALMSLAGKESFKQAVLSAAKKHAAGQTLSAAETKLLREAAGITAAARIKAATAAGKTPGTALATPGQLAALDAAELAGGVGRIRAAGLTQARVGGAGLASVGQNYLTGVADVYGETVESGNPERAVAAAMGIPYALLETAPEFLLAGRVFGNVGGRNSVFGTTPLKDIPGKLGKVGELTKRGGVGFMVGGTAGGLTEAGQEGLLIGANEELDWDSPEGMNRLINSFAAGFGVGGPIGGVGGLFGTDSKAPANMLNPAQSPEPAAATVRLLPPPANPQEGELMPPQLPPPGPPGLPGAGGNTFPTILGTPPGTTPGTILTGEGAIPTGPGTQAVLPLFDTMPAAEMAERMGGVPALPAALPPGTGAQPVSDTFTNPQQGALQFAPAAPEAPVASTALGMALQQAIDRARRGTEFEQATGQRQLTEQEQRDADYERAIAQRELQAASVPVGTTLENMPMREAGPRQPQQLPLFKRGQTPRPSRTELLRKGIAPLRTEAAPAPVDLEPTGNVQLEMFTNEGKPTVAALKGAGLRRKIKPVPAGTGIKQAPPTGKKLTREDIAAARAGAEEKAGPKRGLKKQAGIAKVEKANAVQERSAEAVDAREQAATGKGMGGQVPPARQAARAIAQLRKGKAVTDTGEPDRKEAIVPENVKPPKEEPPVPKTEAAAAVSAAAAQPAPAAKPATSAKAEAGKPVPITVELADGRTMRIPDGKKLLDKLDKDIEKFEQFLACLLGK
jgi:hypothetical protein